MSKFRLTSSLATFAAALALTGWLGVRSFPLQAAPQEKIDAPGVAVQPGALTLLHRAPVQYPPDAIAKRIEGTVLLELTLGETGTVQDARVISGPDELRNAALKSVLQWHYASDRKVAAKTQAAIEFKLPAAGAPPAGVAIRPAAPPASTVKRIVIQTPDYVKQRIENHVTLREGDQLTQAAVDDLFASVKEVDEHLMVSLQPAADPLASIVTIYLPAAIAPPQTPQSIRVGPNVVAANLIHKVPPIYPPLAKQARIQGTVRFTVTIGKDGRVASAELETGHPLLVEAARAALLEWVYKPTLLNGQPVEVRTSVDIMFTLSDQ